jgi:transcription factor A, mitochondrial
MMLSIGNFRMIFDFNHILHLYFFRLAAASIPNSNFHSQNALCSKSVEEQLGIQKRPTRPLTPYFRYLQEIRPKLKSENPNLPLTEIIKLCAKKWETVEESKKNNLVVLYQKEHEEYLKKRAQYDSNLTDDQRLLIEEAKESKKIDRQKRAYRQVNK